MAPLNMRMNNKTMKAIMVSLKVIGILVCVLLVLLSIANLTVRIKGSI
jgi:hypothetical protein